MIAYFEALQPLIKRNTTLGNPILVDDIDSDLLIYSWSESSGRKYASNSINGRWCYLHTLIMERVLGRKLNRGEVVDHINGQPLDNRRSNLRIATDSQNKANSKKRNGANKYRGVYPSNHKAKPFRACITADGKQRTIGYFETEEEAAQARDRVAQEVWGEFARLNNV